MPPCSPHPLPLPPQRPQEFSLRSFWEDLPLFLFYAFGVSFLGVALAIGIFRPRKQMPVDMFQVGGAGCWVLGAVCCVLCVVLSCWVEEEGQGGLQG